jgi:hypothetical protein
MKLHRLSVRRFPAARTGRISSKCGRASKKELA